MMGDIPASYDALLKEELKKKHRLAVVILEAELTKKLLRYLYSESEPRLDRYLAAGDSLAERATLRAKMGPAAFSNLARVCHGLPSLPCFAQHVREEQRRRGTPEREGKEFLASYAEDIVGNRPPVIGRGMGLGWGPLPELRDVGASERGTLKHGEKVVCYGKQFAYWADASPDEMLANFSLQQRDNVAIWEFSLPHTITAPFWIGLHPENEHSEIINHYGAEASSETSSGLGAVLLGQPDQPGVYASMHHELATTGDEYARRHTATEVLRVAEPPLRFVLAT